MKMRHPSTKPCRGFTLIEAAIVTAIVGLGIVGLLELIAAGSMANIESAETTTAVYLAENVNEMMQGVSYATLKSTYDNVTYSTVKDGRGQNLTGFSGWSQVIDVSYVDPDLITMAVPDTQVERTSVVTVSVLHNTKKLYTLKWLVASPS
jgi:Tfp pilus assembly protein PilV